MMRTLVMVALVTGALIDLCGLKLPPAWAQDSSGFLYIDCGANASYIDPVTGIQWVPDSPYINTGKNQENVGPSVDYPDFPELKTLRFFDDLRAKKFCYSLPVTPNSTYMLRATFLYGNYDQAGKPPTFDLSLDASIVDRVSTFSNMPTHREFSYLSERNVTYLCLSPIDNLPGMVPFISAIALKPSDYYRNTDAGDYLANRIYFSVRTRVNFGGSHLIRYPEDIYDRYWYPQGVNSSYLKPTTSPLHTLTSTHTIMRPNTYAPPEAVLQSAITTDTGNTITALMLSPDSSRPYQYMENESYSSTWLAVHFSELDPSANLTTRQFYTRVPGNSLVTFTNTFNSSWRPPGPFGSITWCFGYTGPDVQNGKSAGPATVFFITPTNDSVWGPMVNAMELFSIAQFSSLKTLQRDALAIESIKSSMSLTEWSGDPCLPYPYPWITCSLPEYITVQTQPYITAVNLSGFNLTSVIPPQFADLTALTSLSLDSNELTGWLPDLSSLTNLKKLHLENNKLNGTLPDWLTLLTHLEELFVQNNYFDGNIPASLLPPIHFGNHLNFIYRPGNPSLSAGLSGSSAGLSAVKIVAIVVSVVALIVLVIVVYCLWLRHNSKQRGNLNQKESIKGSARAYSHAEVASLTGNFGHQIGKGGFGPVYLGQLPDSGLQVAVKVSDGSSCQGKTEFLNEVSILSRVHHKYLVELVGYCQTETKYILLYEYIENGSLHDHLRGNSKNDKITALTWKMRLQIALHAAQGLEYLHTGCRPSFIHRDVKSSNILLDSRYDAKVADFGLTKLVGDEEASQVATSVKGTLGYLDPEYYSSGYLTTKSDVFSFGVVLLELITGRPPISPGPFTIDHPPMHLSEWVHSCVKNGDMDAIVDVAVKGVPPSQNAVWRVTEIALQCVEPASVHRPTMSQVVQDLHQAVALQG